MWRENPGENKARFSSPTPKMLREKSTAMRPQWPQMELRFFFSFSPDLVFTPSPPLLYPLLYPCKRTHWLLGFITSPLSGTWAEVLRGVFFPILLRDILNKSDQKVHLSTLAPSTDWCQAIYTNAHEHRSRPKSYLNRRCFWSWLVISIHFLLPYSSASKGAPWGQAGARPTRFLKKL